MKKEDIDVEFITKDITLEMFRNWHYAVGEDFLDQVSSIGCHKVFGGFLMVKYPHRTKDILRVCNDEYGEIMSYSDIPELDYCEEKGINLLYKEFTEFLNLTEISKAKANLYLGCPHMDHAELSELEDYVISLAETL